MAQSWSDARQYIEIDGSPERTGLGIWYAAVTMRAPFASWERRHPVCSDRDALPMPAGRMPALPGSADQLRLTFLNRIMTP